MSWSRLYKPCMLIVVLLAAGCGGGGRLERAPGSALWVAGGSENLAPETLRRMEANGIGEVFVPLGTLDPAADPVLERRSLPQLPPGTRVTMVLHGNLASGLDAELGERTAAAVRQARFDVEGRGDLAVGVHVDPLSIGSFEELAAFLGGLNGALDPDLYLSLSLRRGDLDDELLPKALAEVDFVVPFLYGQLPSEAESSDAWDFGRLGDRLSALEQHDVPYLVGIIGLGTATHVAKGGRVRDRSTHHSLKSFLWNRKLKLQTGFSLEGADRRTFELVAQGPTKVGDWEFETGDVARVVRSTTFHLTQLHDMLAREAYPHHLGQVYYRLTTPDEPLSISLDNILNVLESTTVTPDLTLEAQVQRRTARGWLFRFIISNENGEMTELSTVDSNYLQVAAVGGQLAAEVGTGDFFRYELFRTQKNGVVKRTFRKADSLRLYIPMIEGQGRVTSGDVEVYMRKPVLRLTGQFLLTDGRTLEVGPWLWSDGQLHDERPGAVEEEEAVDDEGADEAAP